MFKERLKQFIPPIVLTLNRRGRKKAKEELNPKWHKVQEGFLRGVELYVDPAYPVYQEMLSGDHDGFIWNYLQSAKPTGETIIDVGTHIGYHAMVMAEILSETKQVIGFEPNPNNIDRAKKIFKRNPKFEEFIHIEQTALSDSTGTIRFRFSDNVDNQTSSGGHIVSVTPPQELALYEKLNFKEVDVQTVSLDNALDKYSIDGISMIKIDVEGAEHLVLKGALNTLNKFRPLLIIEIHSVFCMLEVCNILQPLDYKIDLLKFDRPSRGFVTCLPN